MPKKLTEEDFVIRSKLKHQTEAGKTLYDYSKVNYINCYTNVKIICYLHGEFMQTPASHLFGKGCIVCGGRMKLNTETFIQKSQQIHKDSNGIPLYKYSLTKYTKSKDKVLITCKKHGDFYQLAASHLRGCGCQKCSGTMRLTQQEFIEKSKHIHKDKNGNPLYDYSHTKYINNETKITIVCPIHGKFKQTPYCHHICGCGCQKCGLKKQTLARFSTKEKWISKTFKIHGDKYDYSLVEYKDSNTKVKIICKKHGIFEQTPHNHLTGNNCPSCKESKYEAAIRLILEQMKIKFEFEKRFEDCKSIYPLSFDFYLPDYNMCIEYDGEQHYSAIKIYGGYKGLRGTKIRDKIKNNYCIKNNIKLLRIPYWESKRIKEILKKEIK